MASRKEVFFDVLENIRVGDIQIQTGEYPGYVTDRRSDTGGVAAYILAIPAIETVIDADSAAGARPARDLDVTAAISEGKVRVTEDRGE